MGNYAASGGYWVSTYGDRIFAETNTITGSIGVFGMFFDVQKLANTYGITFDTAKTGNYADFETDHAAQDAAGTRARPVPRGRPLRQVRRQGLRAAATSRTPRSQAIAQGRVWAGTEALNLHLVDEIGGLQKAIDYAADKAKLGTSYELREVPKQVTFAETISTLLSNQEAPVEAVKPDLFTRQLLKMKADLKTLQEFNDPMGMYARLPLGFNVR